MHEDFLHHVWKYQKFKHGKSLTSQQGEHIEIIEVGHHNTSKAGPDFLNARVRIENQLWAGNVEIHIKASDWYTHRHEEDPNYDNVILHVVWDEDVEIYRSQQELIPCLQLKYRIDPQTKHNYNALTSRLSKLINCEKSFNRFDKFTLDNWLERLYIERLEQKTKDITHLLTTNNSDWEDALFKLLAKNFGLNKNADSFLNIAQQIGYKRLLKHRYSLEEIESLLLGTAGLLEVNNNETYIKSLKLNYKYLKHKYNLKKTKFRPEFFRLRPDNFPSIRLAQLAKIYHKTPHLFQTLIHVKTKTEIYTLFQHELGEFWDTHYSLTKSSPMKRKKMSQKFIDLLIINTIVPLKFQYEKQKGNLNFERLFSILKSLKPEKNSIVNTFDKIRPKTNTSAFNSQALLHLKVNYCDKNYCLNCHLGQKLINQSI